MASVRLEAVRKIYEDRGRIHVAVDDVNLEVADGEFIVLVGPSGCGKSTTLRMIAGLETISAGQLWIGDRLVNDVPAKQRDIAMVFQNYALYPHMTARDNMAFALRLRHLPREEIDRRVRDAAAVLGIETLLDRRPRQMSGGQRQRVAVGRAIVRQPQVFLFDEPLSNLDAKLRVQMRRELARLHRQLGATMVYVTHDQVEAMTLGDRIVVLDAGRVQQVDTPMRLYDRPRNTFVATFIGSPPMNLIPGTVDDGRFRTSGAALDLPIPPAWRDALAARRGADVILGIRPEDLRLVDGLAAVDGAIRARLELVELMGNEMLLSLRARDQDVVARTTPAPLPPVGGELFIVADPDRLHFFDAQTRMAIDRG